MVQDFKFDHEVANSFDSMIEKSIPLYQPLQELVQQLSNTCIKPNTSVYDLGCATGTTLHHLGSHIKDDTIKWIGIDNSPDMLSKAEEKCAPIFSSIQFDQADLNQDYTFKNASLTLLVLTLQFIRPINRGKLIQSIYDGLEKGGACIVVEKVISASAYHNRWFIALYHQFKKDQGYSNEDIIKKRESIENVLVPYTVEENLKLFSDNGFSNTEIFFKWLNFAGFIAIK